MRILFLTQLVPLPLDAGPKVRAYYVLRHLVRSGHEVHLLSLSRRDDDAAAAAELGSLCASVATVPIERSPARDAWHLSRSLVGRTPFLVARDWVPALARAVDQRLGSLRFDAVHADQLAMAPYALRARGSGAGGPSIVLDRHNALFRLLEQLAARARFPLAPLLRREAHRLRRFEREVCARADHVVWVSAADRDALAVPPRASTTVIPICVDPGAQPPLARAPRGRVVFLGGLNWPPNRAGVRWLVEQVWPRVRRRVVGARLTVIGRAGRGPMPTGESVELLGYVADPLPLLGEADVLVVPLATGAGLRVKILDAWCHALPVVSTEIGAEGLLAEDGENLLLADAAEAFAAAVVRVMHEPALAARLAAGGRATVERHYDWRRVYRDWDAIYPPPGGRAAGAETVTAGRAAGPESRRP